MSSECQAARQRRAPQRGLALVAVLWVLMLLSLVAASFMATTRTEINLTRNLIENAKAEALADAGGPAGDPGAAGQRSGTGLAGGPQDPEILPRRWHGTGLDRLRSPQVRPERQGRRPARSLGSRALAVALWNSALEITSDSTARLRYGVHGCPGLGSPPDPCTNTQTNHK